MCTVGVATERDLAQACRDYFSPHVTVFLWVLCEIAIAACDLTEVVGSAIALNLLFHLPLVWGVCLTAVDVLVLLMAQRYGFRHIEALIITLVSTIGLCFVAEMTFASPDGGEVVQSLVPSLAIVQQPTMFYVALGRLGATLCLP